MRARLSRKRYRHGPRHHRDGTGHRPPINPFDVAKKQPGAEDNPQRAGCDGDKGLVIRLEDMLASETDHIEQLERLGR